jgi:hypothetical protein
LRLKHIASLLFALLLAAALAVPAFAEPDPNEAVTTTGLEENAEPRSLSEDEIKEMISAAVADLQPQTTIGIVPISGDGLLLAPAEEETLFSQRNMTLAALGFSGFAVLLSIIALARTRKKTVPNATGNYQKYF